MFKSFIQTIKDSWPARVALLFLLAMTAWWVTMYNRGLTAGVENDAFTVLYGLVALWGGVWGLYYAQYWGGWKSLLGRSLIAFSLGLLGQEFGQVVYSYYIYVMGVEVPFPSLGDVGFFSTWVFYAYGLILLAKVSGIRVSLKSYSHQAQAVIIPLIFLAGAYAMFLRDYEFDFSQPIKIILEFGYPLGDAVYISLATLIFILSRKVLGGVMRGPVLFLLIALILEAIADFTFNYQVIKETWYVGGTNDFLYLWAYSLMAIGLMQIGVLFNHLRDRR